MARSSRLGVDTNPYIAFSDLTLNLVFVLIFFVVAMLAVSQSGWEQVRYKQAQDKVAAAIRAAKLPVSPTLLLPGQRNDPPGAQRWVFPSGKMFAGETAALTPDGQKILTNFARVLKANLLWERIRIEGHTQTSREGVPERWDLSAARASAVAEVFYNDGRIPPYRLAVAARGGQTPFAGRRFDALNERVEIVVEYASKAAN